MVTDDQPLSNLYRRILGPATIGRNAYRYRLGRHLHLRLSWSRSAIGRILISIGFNFADSSIAAYALGAVVVVGLVYLLGIAVESRLESRVRRLIDSLMQRIPFVGNLYDITRRFLAS